MACGEVRAGVVAFNRYLCVIKSRQQSILSHSFKYKGQHEKDRWNRHKGAKKTQNRTVQWDLKRNIEKSLSRGLDSSNSREDTLNSEGKKGAGSMGDDRNRRYMSTSAIIPTRIVCNDQMSISVIHLGAKDHQFGRQIRCGEYELGGLRDNRAPNYEGFNHLQGDHLSTLHKT